jgi:hypothetical protein
MTRREEIVTATLGCRQSYADLKRPIIPDDVADAFEKGAYWADKTMIEKACECHKNQVFVSLVRKMREAQEREAMLSGEEDDEFLAMVCVEARRAERKVDEYLKKMEDEE